MEITHLILVVITLIICQEGDLVSIDREYIKKKVEDTISSLEMATEKLRNYDSVVADILDDTNLFENKKIYNK